MYAITLASCLAAGALAIVVMAVAAARAPEACPRCESLEWRRFADGSGHCKQCGLTVRAGFMCTHSAVSLSGRRSAARRRGWGDGRGVVPLPGPRGVP